MVKCRAAPVLILLFGMELLHDWLVSVVRFRILREFRTGSGFLKELKTGSGFLKELRTGSES